MIDFEPDGTRTISHKVKYGNLHIEENYGLQQGEDWYPVLLQRKAKRRERDASIVAVCRMAEWCEAQGNKGFTTKEISEAGLPGDLLTRVDKLALEGILFINNEDKVFCRKNPEHWKQTFLKRWGGWDNPDHPDIAELVLEYKEAQARKEAEEAKLVRSHGKKCSLGYFEEYTDYLSSETLAWQVAALHILCERQRVRYYESHAHRKESIPAMLMDVYRQERHLLMQELEYRAQGAIPEPKSSKKKFKAAVEDFAKAKDLLAAGWQYFYTEAFKVQAIESAEEPDLAVNFDSLPKKPSEQAPVKYMTEGELVKAFFQFVLIDYDADSFEWEDKQLLLSDLRVKMAAIKGQRIESV